MKNFRFTLLRAAILFCNVCLAQPVQSTAPVEDFKPPVTNQPGRLFPQVISEHRIRASLNAPQANSVQLDLGGKKHALTKDEKGV